MKVLIGGAGSTGSTLLRRILHRHPKIFSGPELNFFNKVQFFEDWDRYKKRIFWPSRFLSTQGWVPYTGTRLLKKEYGWTKNQLKQLINDSKSLKEFVNKYFQRPLQKNDASIWIAKTPSNSYTFEQFLNLFDDGKVIHITRSPYDSVASLLSRDYKPFFAAGMYIYNMAMALKAQNRRRYLRIKYENLVKNPDQTLEKVFKFLELEFTDEVLKPEDSEIREKITTWSSQPNQKISKVGLSRFQKTDNVTQEKIITALSVFRISKKHEMEKHIPFTDCEAICKPLEYSFDREVNNRFKGEFYREIFSDYVWRCYKFYPTGWFNYPAKLNWNLKG